MISIESSETNKKRALKIQDKFVLDWVNAKSMAQSMTNLSRIFNAKSMAQSMTNLSQIFSALFLLFLFVLDLVTDWVNAKSMAQSMTNFQCFSLLNILPLLSLFRLNIQNCFLRNVRWLMQCRHDVISVYDVDK